MKGDNMTRNEQVQAILKQHPLLHDGGYGRLCGKELVIGRSALLTPAAIQTIDNICCWLSLNISPQCSINGRHSSYGLKHVFEGATGEYCSNGQFIVAALIVGYAADCSHYNVAFAMSERSIRQTWDVVQGRRAWTTIDNRTGQPATRGWI